VAGSIIFKKAIVAGDYQKGMDIAKKQVSEQAWDSRQRITTPCRVRRQATR
jgi:hypothetical protein